MPINLPHNIRFRGYSIRFIKYNVMCIIIISMHKHIDLILGEVHNIFLHERKIIFILQI